jgi:hypothetical protein
LKDRVLTYIEDRDNKKPRIFGVENDVAPRRSGLAAFLLAFEKRIQHVLFLNPSDDNRNVF